MFKPRGFTLAFICVAMVSLTVQSANMANELEIEPKDRIESMKEASKREVKKQRPVSVRPVNAALKAPRWRKVSKSRILKEMCNKCPVWGAVGWNESTVRKCQAFTHFRNRLITLPEVIPANLDNLRGTECFSPHILKASPPQIKFGMFDAAAQEHNPKKLREGCGCLKKLTASNEACGDQKCTDRLLCSCTGFCRNFKMKIIDSRNCTVPAAKDMQKRSAPIRKISLMRSEHTVSEQLLMRNNVASESKQEGGNLDETLDEKCSS